MAIANVSCTSMTAARIDSERSNKGCIWIAGRQLARASAAACARTMSTTSTVLASGWRWIASTIARASLNQVAILSFSTLSMTRATSDELDRRAVAIGHDHVAIVGGVLHRAGRQQRHACVLALERADRRGRIGLGDDGADLIERNIACCGRRGIDLNAHGEFLRAVDTDTCATPGNCEICGARTVSA